jgi:hypothetical protein
MEKWLVTEFFDIPLLYIKNPYSTEKLSVNYGKISEVKFVP